MDCLSYEAESVDPDLDEEAPEVVLEGRRVLQPEDVQVPETLTHSIFCAILSFGLFGRFSESFAKTSGTNPTTFELANYNASVAVG
jgi:hypothetical protein